jgi:hypothetical protein
MSFVPVADAAFANKALVSNRANVHVLASPLRSLIAGHLGRLGINIGIYADDAIKYATPDRTRSRQSERRSASTDDKARRANRAALPSFVRE